MEIINCYKGFEKVYQKSYSNEELLNTWIHFMEKHKSVRKLCIEDYEIEGLDWKQVAKEKVFVYDSSFVKRMNKTSLILEDVIISMSKKLKDFYALSIDDITIVIYHGLGNSAGWVTSYKGRPAIYLGVEKIVELGWDNTSRLEDLVSHEYGHLVHMEIRNSSLSLYKDFKRKTIFRIYNEGVATYCEGIFNGREKTSKEWYEKALSIEDELRKEFLNRYNNEDSSIQHFFGDWNLVLGITEAGYFMGYMIIKHLIKTMSIEDIMKLEFNTIEFLIMKYLEGNIEEYNFFRISLDKIIPQQHYLSKDKYEKIKESMNDNNSYGIIYVIEYKNKIFSVDGHHRLLYLYKNGIKEIDVVCEVSDNKNLLYQKLSDEALKYEFRSIIDLENRVLTSYKEYEMKWIDKCQILLLEDSSKENYFNDPCRYSALPLYKEIRMNKENISVIHNDNFDISVIDQYSYYERFFRISHNLNNITESRVPGYSFKICDINNDLDMVRQMINQSYTDIKIYNDQIILMTKDRVYYPNLWVFIIDEKTDQEVALGICHYDESVKEVELDWIQVLPQYRGKGLGKMLVLHLLKNSPSGAKFATVSGDIDNPDSPEMLYRKCGFKGEDVWHILRK